MTYFLERERNLKALFIRLGEELEDPAVVSCAEIH